MHGPTARPKAARHKACISCAKLRSKCDNVRPCAQCVRRNLGDACEDPERKSSCTMCRRLRTKCDKQRPCRRCVESRQASACSSIADMMASRHRGRSNASVLLALPDGFHCPPASVTLATPSHDGPGAVRATAVHLGSYASIFDGWRTVPSARVAIDIVDVAPPPAPCTGVSGTLLEKSLVQRENVSPLETPLHTTEYIETVAPLNSLGEVAYWGAEDSASKCSIDGWEACDVLERSHGPKLDLWAFGEAF